MKPTLGAKQEIQVGNPIVIEAESPDGRFGVVFEDDGETGYFYARDFSVESLFVDALHIYSVKDVTDRHLTSTVHILWSADSSKSCLIINQYPHALFDFSAKRGHNRDEFPTPTPDAGWTRHPWQDSLRALFYS
jgi:hypothetical protein